METTQPRAAANRTRFIVALAASLIVFSLLFPWGGGQDAVEGAACFGMFLWYTVPCGGGVAIAAGLATGALAWMVLWLIDRRRA